MWYFAPGEIFENILQLKRFGLNFERILNRKWLLSYRNGDISYKECWGVQGHVRQENFELIDAIWCVLIRFSLKKSTIIYFKE